ncbi:hypothetical protein NDU88_004027 [Pleurodeles waltl]|uniref:Uncharacterized protein n=1 Tax=Pleurodeles waltl TaxID=8319 RepID=A0AAV7T6K1_PLEWA|nr:hypothetical protein NDU88_004027 [Pleurodeles waltl]
MAYFEVCGERGRRRSAGCAGANPCPSLGLALYHRNFRSEYSAQDVSGIDKLWPEKRGRGEEPLVHDRSAGVTAKTFEWEVMGGCEQEQSRVRAREKEKCRYFRSRGTEIVYGRRLVECSRSCSTSKIP